MSYQNWANYFEGHNDHFDHIEYRTDDELTIDEEKRGVVGSLGHVSLPQMKTDPPSTAIVWPVMNELASEMRNITAPTRSSERVQQPFARRTRRWG